jgi:Big-like domain-containing protein
MCALVRLRASAVALLLVGGCRDASLTERRPYPTGPTHEPVLWMRIYAGDQHYGTIGQFLDPLAVRVTDDKGSAVENLEVRWKVTAGAGEFDKTSGVTRTQTNGIASILFRPVQPGLTKVVAEADVIDGSPIVFTLSAAGPAVVVIRFGPLFDCLDPSFFPEVTEARVGSVVTWVYAKWPGFDCAAQLRSISVPPAGASFTSGVIKPGERFTFVPNVAGDWTYEDSMNGGAATLRVRE